MIFPYTVDKNIFDFDEANFELWCERVRSFLEAIEKQSFWIDCQLDAMNNSICKKVTDCDNDYTKSALLELWKKHFWGKNFNVRNTCECDDPGICDISTSSQKVSEFYDDVKFIYSNDDVKGTIEKVSVDDYRDSTAYHYCINYTEINVGPFSYEIEGDNFLKEYWGWAFKLTKQVTIIDKIAFKCWKQDGEDYKNGIEQFCRIANDINHELRIRIISQLSEGDNRSINELYLSIYDFINTVDYPELEFRFADKANVFRHDRYILFDRIFGAYISTGLTNFLPTTSINSITYHNRAIVESHIRVTEPSIIKHGDFKPIRNF